MCMKLQTCKYSTISAVELGSSKALDSEFVKARFWFIDCFATCSNAGLWNRADAQSLSCSLFFFFSISKSSHQNITKYKSVIKLVIL